MEDFILDKDKLEEKLNNNLEKLNYSLEKSNIFDLMELLGSKRKLFVRNFISGISKGIGIGIGFTVLSGGRTALFRMITAILIIILQKIVTLNIPVIGDYIADIVDIVQSK